MGWPAIQGYQNGEQIVADVLNKPLNQLAERTEYLLNLLTLHKGNEVTISATVSNPDGAGLPTVGQPVYRVSDGTYAKAAGITSENAWFYASQAAMAVGVVIAVSGTTATIALYGYHSFGSTEVTAASVIADESPVSGRYYLASAASTSDYGKFTASPNGPVIYMCDIQLTTTNGVQYVSSMLISPQYRDTGESHVHRSFVISGKPAGGYAVQSNSRYYAYGIKPDGVTPTSGTLQTGFLLELYGSWLSDDSITYTFNVVEDTTSSASGWAKYKLQWTSGGDDGTGSASLSELASATSTSLITVGTKGLQVKASITSSSITPAAQVSKTWTVAMPDAARVWVNYYSGTTHVGYRLNLGMYLVMARYVPLHPVNAASLTVGGLDMRGPIFGDDKAWEVLPATSEGGPWLVWYGGEVDANSVTTPFVWSSDTTAVTERDIVLNVNRMRVGPDGFVTSLQVAEGAPFKITSAQTDAEANQGALQISMDKDFTSTDGDVAGHRVVKRITGSVFETGPVVEKIVAGPGVSVSPQGGQGTVTVSVSNAVYAGDFETIALKNAKQDVAGGIFPYIKLLSWNTTGTNINTGFTAKFRVPDHIPYKKYNVIVSASIFGEVAAASDMTAAFNLQGFSLRDYSCSLDSLLSDGTDNTDKAIVTGTNGLTTGQSVVVNVPFASGHAAFDPIVLHGFSTIPTTDNGQRVYVQDLLLKDNTADKAAIGVYPGYFVGLAIDRCGLVSTSTATPYTSPIGFLSLRWNLIEA